MLNREVKCQISAFELFKIKFPYLFMDYDISVKRFEHILFLDICNVLVTKLNDLEKINYSNGTWAIPFGKNIEANNTTVYQYCLYCKGETISRRTARIMRIEYMRPSPKSGIKTEICTRYVAGSKDKYEFLKLARQAIIDFEKTTVI